MVITINQMSRVFQTEEIETTALNQVSLNVKKGEFISVMGPSGCGKSTLLNIIGLLDNASSGSYLLLDKEMVGLTESQRAQIRKENIGFIFQNFNLIDELTVYDNIELPLIYNKVPSSERKKRVMEIAERLNIVHRLKHYPQQLSGGQQQRVAVGRALVTNPKIILADEPTGNLDSKNGNEVMELLTELHQQGATIIMVTHSNHDASYSERTILMKDGMILSEKMNTKIVDVFAE
ncbi:phosphonate ABC transporter ATP-binding protein [Myroides sp. ZB35]|uniref:Phosphonate ABC transporter ATP-binding protein n=2 Tax=Myroides odoratimimus TaxID=76832 RepID=A0AAI8C2D7_9FLAO|nr:phosphonate ABC transporter ATP-binding protein [Myroides odoratimimus]APA91410.1 phosphonate ABC transporter ATP-binding protein [Myroides sp. ZB35]